MGTLQLIITILGAVKFAELFMALIDRLEGRTHR